MNQSKRRWIVESSVFATCLVEVVKQFQTCLRYSTTRKVLERTVQGGRTAVVESTTGQVASRIWDIARRSTTYSVLSMDSTRVTIDLYEQRTIRPFLQHGGIQRIQHRLKRSIQNRPIFTVSVAIICYVLPSTLFRIFTGELGTWGIVARTLLLAVLLVGSRINLSHEIVSNARIQHVIDLPESDAERDDTAREQ